MLILTHSTSGSTSHDTSGSTSHDTSTKGLKNTLSDAGVLASVLMASTTPF